MSIHKTQSPKDPKNRNFPIDKNIVDQYGNIDFSTRFLNITCWRIHLQNRKSVRFLSSASEMNNVCTTFTDQGIFQTDLHPGTTTDPWMLTLTAIAGQTARRIPILSTLEPCPGYSWCWMIRRPDGILITFGYLATVMSGDLASRPWSTQLQAV